MSNVIIAAFRGDSRFCTTRSVFQIDRGDMLKFVGITLPEYYEVHFSNSKQSLATRVLASGDSVVIPWEYMRHGQNQVYAWVYLTPDAETGYTPYQVTIPLNLRSDISDDQPTPEQESIVGQAISALNEGVTRAEDAADNAEEAAGHYPRIVDGHWYVWDVEHERWVDTGVSAGGDGSDSVKVISQTWSAEQQAQARENIGAADVSIYQAARVDISNPNTNSSTKSIVVTGDNAGTTGEQSIHVGAGYMTENCALMIGTRVRMNNDDYIIHPEYADYVENGYLESKLNSRGSVVIGASQVYTSYTDVPAFAFGSKCIAGGGLSIVMGQCCMATGNLAVAIGDGLAAKYGRQFVVCKYNNCLAEDLLEVGNGARGARSNAFRVTSTGHAIAQNALGIEDGNGGVVEISAAELQALKNLLT